MIWFIDIYLKGGGSMANDAKVVCKNVFKNCDKVAFTKAFTLKWIELINQYEKNKGRATPAR